MKPHLPGSTPPRPAGIPPVCRHPGSPSGRV